VLVAKYADHLPLYRQSEIYAREGVDLDRSTLADWVGAASHLLSPLVDQLRRHVLAASKLHADDTPVGRGVAPAYTIDPFGNKTQQTTTSGVAPSPSYGVAASNGLTGNILQYDLAGSVGNVTNDGQGHAFQYDAEGRLYSVNGTTCYTYDGDGDRVAKDQLQCGRCGE
jgi:YD repeat-containing protein